LGNRLWFRHTPYVRSLLRGDIASADSALHRVFRYVAVWASLLSKTHLIEVILSPFRTVVAETRTRSTPAALIESERASNRDIKVSPVTRRGPRLVVCWRWSVTSRSISF